MRQLRFGSFGLVGFRCGSLGELWSGEVSPGESRQLRFVMVGQVPVRHGRYEF